MRDPQSVPTRRGHARIGLSRRLAPLALAAAVAAPPGLCGEEPRARELHRALTAQPRLAGTSGSLWGARTVARVLTAAGWQVEVETRQVLLSLPRRLALEAFEERGVRRAFLSRRWRFDPDAKPPGDLPPFNAWTASGEVRAPLVDVGRGLRADYERLAAAGVEVRGAIAFARYGGAYRGVKVSLAAEHGCVGVLLVNDPADDGAAKGPVWPAGPWKPAQEVQRGSILPLAAAPGDPSTPGWPSPRLGEQAERLAGEALRARLPRLLCLPVPWSLAGELRARLAPRVLEPGGEELPVGPGPLEVRLAIDAPIELRAIRNVIATLRGASEDFVLAGNHRDAWVRGGVDAGSGTVTLLRAAERLGERARAGWAPAATIRLAFWDAEESGLIGSTEWGEAHADELVRHLIAYVNCDAVVGGPQFHGASGTPGLRALLEEAASRVPSASGAGTLLEEWSRAADESGRRLDLPGSGSDHAVFLHHLGLPVLDIGFRGRPGGEYHTAFDDHPYVDRFRDPTWQAHETAGRLVAELLALAAERAAAAFDERAAARRYAALAREQTPWLGAERAGRLAAAFERLAAAAAGAPALGEGRLLRRLAAPEGLPGRPWFRNRLWAPGVESGYGAETFPTLRQAAGQGEEALEAELADLVGAIDALADERGAR